MTIAVMPTQWSKYKDIEDVEPLNASDTECLKDIRAVLKRHNRLERFGVALLHKHFDLGPNELLVEHTDKIGRTLTIRPETDCDPDDVTQTIWELKDEENGFWLGCRQYCGKDVHGKHNSFHEQRDF